MYDGLNIRWRETAPDRGLLNLALDELSSLHEHWPETVQCDILIERAKSQPGEGFQARVEIAFGKSMRMREKRVQAAATSGDAPQALRTAFAKLRKSFVKCEPAVIRPSQAA